MTVGVFNAASKRILEELENVVRELLGQQGVPTGSAALYDFVAALLPFVLQSRESLYREAVLMMGRQVAQHGFEVKPAAIREYPAKALFDALGRPLSITGGGQQAKINVSVLDPESQKSALETVFVDKALSFDQASIDKTAKKFVAIAQRHASDAARQAVADTSALNEVRVLVRNEPQRSPARVVRSGASGTVLGWARVLTGQESCPWCAMLASRGPVYDESTVVTRSDGRTYHDFCDCAAVMVVKGRKWEGEVEYKKLRDLWEDASERPTAEELDGGMRKPLSRFGSRFKKVLQEDKNVFVPDSLQV